MVAHLFLGWEMKDQQTHPVGDRWQKRFELERSLKNILFHPLPWAGPPSTPPVFSKPHPSCPWTLQGWSSSPGEGYTESKWKGIFISLNFSSCAVSGWTPPGAPCAGTAGQGGELGLQGRHFPDFPGWEIDGQQRWESKLTAAFTPGWRAALPGRLNSMFSGTFRMLC